MSGKRLTWNKSYGAKWRDEASDLLGGVARAARALLGDLATLESGSDVGWAIDDRGLAYTPARLARLLGFPEEQVAEALEQLLAAGVACRVNSRLGLIGWRATQEDPSAERQRRRRSGGHEQDVGVTPGVTVTPPVTPPVTPESRQRTEDRGQRTDPGGGAPRGRATTLGQRLRLAREGGAVPMTEAALAKALGLDVATVRAFEADEQVPTRHELRAIAGALRDPDVADLALPTNDHGPAVVAWVANKLRELELELGIVGADAPPPKIDGTTARWVFTPGGTAEELLAGWTCVLRRAAEKIRRELERGASDSASWFTLQHLAKPKIWREYLEKHDLDHRRDSTPKSPRASPGRGRPLPPVNRDLEPEVQEG